MFVVGVGNGCVLGWMMFRSGLVPRRLAVLGLIGGPLIVASGSAAVLGLIEPGGALQELAAAPEFFWELGLGIYLVAKGFRPAALTAMRRQS
jgi:gamma-glutamyltranspeptidase